MGSGIEVPLVLDRISCWASAGATHNKKIARMPLARHIGKFLHEFGGVGFESGERAALFVDGRVEGIERGFLGGGLGDGRVELGFELRDLGGDNSPTYGQPQSKQVLSLKS